MVRDIKSAELRASDLPANFQHTEQIFHYAPLSPATALGMMIGSDGYSCMYGDAPPWTRGLLQAIFRSKHSPDHLHVCAWLYARAASAHAAFKVQKSISLYAVTLAPIRIGDEAGVLNPVATNPAKKRPKSMAAGVIFRHQNVVFALIYDWRGAHTFSVSYLERLAKVTNTRLR